MTNEEAIKLVKEVTGMSLDWDDAHYDALQMAIKALEQQPCEDAISRQAAIDATWFEPSYTDPLNVLAEVRDRLKALPSAQPERKKGQWIKEDRGHVEYCAVCDQCGFDWIWSDREYFKFCPNCGAKMEVGENDD